MTPSVYTLLIVESPVLAGIIQKHSPPSVYVMATGGFCWKPKYDQRQNRLKAVADPAKRNIRKELKEQAQWANNIVVATDSDPAGDFIAWSVYRFLGKAGIKRTAIQNLGKSGVETMINEARETDFSRLEHRLQNRFLIHGEWKKANHLPDFELAGLIAVLNHENRFAHFIDENNRLFISSEPVQSNFDEWLTINKNLTKPGYTQHKPLSAFDLHGTIVQNNLAANYTEAQNLLQVLFQTKMQFTGESLISYPRSDTNAFYSETWTRLRNQYIRLGSQNDLKPVFMQETADPETPHESIHPLSLNQTPESVSGELPHALAVLYKIIYEHTLKSISIPSRLSQVFTNDLYPGIHFYPAGDNPASGSESLTINPCFTTADLCTKLCQAGITRPGTIGIKLDEWISKKWIAVENDVVSPGHTILKQLDKSEMLRKKLLELQKFSDQSGLSPETVRQILTS